jgi:glycosyltransferase involved in cell wall biosynthesis
LRIAALICTRNEELHVERCLADIHAAGIETILIDNESEDKTVCLAKKYLGRGLLSIDTVPWRGHFALAEQIEMKRNIIRKIDHDWVLHIDADEWLCSTEAGEPLSDAIARVAADGYNCINFDEMVFAPWPHEDFAGRDYTHEMTTYYFFQRSPRRLMRAWQRDIDPKMSSGHKIASKDLRLYPQNFILRHYIALSHAHAVQKYVGRQFDPAELARGWHRNRASVTSNNFMLKPSPFLRRLDSWDSNCFDKSMPTSEHFWGW